MIVYALVSVEKNVLAEHTTTSGMYSVRGGTKKKTRRSSHLRLLLLSFLFLLRLEHTHTQPLEIFPL